MHATLLQSQTSTLTLPCLHNTTMYFHLELKNAKLVYSFILEKDPWSLYEFLVVPSLTLAIFVYLFISLPFLLSLFLTNYLSLYYLSIYLSNYPPCLSVSPSFPLSLILYLSPSPLFFSISLSPLLTIYPSVMSQRVRESDFIDQLRSIYIPAYRVFQTYKSMSRQKLQVKYIYID